MKKIFGLFILVTINAFSQNQIIDSIDIPKLNAKIRSFEKEYKNSEIPKLKSFSQSEANFFKIVTFNPKNFLKSLEKSKDFEQLVNYNVDIQIDRDLFVVKNVYLNYKKQKVIEIKSFEIENNRDHKIELNYNDSLNRNNIKFIYLIRKETRGEFKGASIIEGFYMIKKFKSYKIPKKYADWVNYTDVMVQPKTTIFFNKNRNPMDLYGLNKTILDSLVWYFNDKTKIPRYVKEKQDYVSYLKEKEDWKSKKAIYSDSLYRKDEYFNKLLHKTLLYAEENKISNEELEDFTAQFYSEKRALNLMRQNQQVGMGSYDNSPLNQQKRIAKLAVKTSDWDVFINSFLNVMNDNVSRVANSNIVSRGRKTYINELAKLDLDINKILMGSNFRINDSIGKHYFSDGSKIAQAYFNLDDEYQKKFKTTIYEILSNKSIDVFNKLHFYNTYLNYKYFLNMDFKEEEMDQDLKKVISLMPKVLKSRIENPNKELKDLLYKEKADLDKFDIKSSSIASILSNVYDGNCWQAALIEKGLNNKIIYNLTMPIGLKITPLKNFIIQKDSIKERVESHDFIQKIIKENSENKIYISFTNDKSFVDYQNKVTKELPKELASSLDFNNAISFYMKYPKSQYVSYLLLKNGNLLLLDIPENFELAGYKFKELMTKEEEVFFSKSYKSFKLFDKQGKILN